MKFNKMNKAEAIAYIKKDGAKPLQWPKTS